MKKIFNILIVTFLFSMFLVSCDDLMNVESDRLTTDSQFKELPNDSIFSMFGILSKMQKIADSYVLLGELRGDLLDINESSDLSLREINNFEISQNNKYVNIKDYYAVINNCNYVLHNIDTAYLDRGQKLKLGEYAAVKSFRAWTFMQIALNFKTVKYYTDPIITVEDSKKIYPEYNINELADILIPDLEPLKEVDFPALDYIISYIPIKMVLGDLYLWKGDYENAAIAYHELMYDKRLAINKEQTSAWIPVNNTISANAYLYWIRTFDNSYNEIVSTIACPTEYGQDYYLDSLNNQHRIVPSAIALKNWDSPVYYLNDASSSQGDLRKYGSVSYDDLTNQKVISDYYFSGVKADDYLIYKYKLYEQYVPVYRASLVYLRYAEAVNRLNKPNLAFAVLKYGLNSTNFFNSEIVPASERGESTPAYMVFNDQRFNNNVGIRMRGLGNVDSDTTNFKFESQNTLEDSVLFVENKIVEELALETAFEGNRFNDLMRIAIRRNDPAFLADKVAEKHTDNKVVIKTKLLDMNNWYISK